MTKRALFLLPVLALLTLGASWSSGVVSRLVAPSGGAVKIYEGSTHVADVYDDGSGYAAFKFGAGTTAGVKFYDSAGNQMGRLLDGGAIGAFDVNSGTIGNATDAGSFATLKVANSTTITNLTCVSATIDVANIPAASTVTTLITAASYTANSPGALGSQTLHDYHLTGGCYVDNLGDVYVRLANPTAAGINPVSTAYRCCFLDF
jgi:hypothetical protein